MLWNFYNFNKNENQSNIKLSYAEWLNQNTINLILENFAKKKSRAWLDQLKIDIYQINKISKLGVNI